MTDEAASPDASASRDEALVQALRQVLAPLARLALARGMTHAVLEELLKRALVEAADQQLATLPAHRRVSRITTITGIHRRDVTRLVEVLRAGEARALPVHRSHASELFHHWRTNPRFCDRHGSPAELPRHAPLPGALPAAAIEPPASFEELAQSITRDVHPRSLLEELVRLGVAAHDAQRDTVRLVREAFVPQGDDSRLLGTLGRNIGGHFEAAVDNVLIDHHSHFEQALFAGGLSDQSMAEFRALVRDQWQALIAEMVPALEGMIERDAQAQPAARHRVRIGLYTHAAPDPSAEQAAASPAPAASAPPNPAPAARTGAGSDIP